MSRPSPRKDPFAIGERIGMWVVLDILPRLGGRLKDYRYLAKPDCCGQPVKIADQTLVKALYPSGANKGWCQGCADRLRRQLGPTTKLPVRDGYVHQTPPLVEAKPELEPVPEPDLDALNRAQLGFINQFLSQPVPAGLTRNLWGHPWAP